MCRLILYSKRTSWSTPISLGLSLSELELVNAVIQLELWNAKSCISGFRTYSQVSNSPKQLLKLHFLHDASQLDAIKELLVGLLCSQMSSRLDDCSTSSITSSGIMEAIWSGTTGWRWTIRAFFLGLAIDRIDRDHSLGLGTLLSWMCLKNGNSPVMKQLSFIENLRRRFSSPHHCIASFI